MKHRASYHDHPKTLYHVIGNIVFDLEEIAPMTQERDLVIQALLGLLAAVELEHDLRVDRIRA